LFERRQEFLVPQRSTGALMPAQDLDVLFSDHPGEETAPVENPLGH
jgi:hypothetical protein